MKDTQNVLKGGNEGIRKRIDEKDCFSVFTNI